MNRYIVFFTLCFSLLNLGGLAQQKDVYDFLANQTCKCIKKEKQKTAEEMAGCFQNTVLFYSDSIKKELCIPYLSESNIDSVSELVHYRLCKVCPQYYNANMNDTLSTFLNHYEKDKKVTCGDLKVGKYYYLAYDEEQVLDSTFVTFYADGRYIEKMKGGTTYSELTCKWKGDCSFTLTFVKSNDLYKSSLSRSGDVYAYKVIQNTSDYFIARLHYGGRDYDIKMIKVKR